MNSGKARRSHSITFQTDHPILSKDHKLYENEFARFGLTGIWLEYNAVNGTAYFSNEEDANEAYRSLNSRNNMNMKLDLPISRSNEHRDNRNNNDDRSGRQHKSKWKDYDPSDIEASVNRMFDVFGNEIPVLYSNEGKVYVPLENIESSGYQLFEKPLCMQEPNEQWNLKLKAFLLHQASIFVYMNQVHFNTKTIFSTVNGMLCDMAIHNKKSSSLNSSGSLQDNESKLQGFKSKTKSETMELGVGQKVKFLNDHVEGIYYIRLMDKEDEYYKIHAETNLVANSSQSITPNLYSVYAVKHNNIWYRAALLKTDPEQEFFFIDEGKFINKKLETRSIPEELFKTPGQAIRVRLTQGCTAKEGQVSEMVATKQYRDGTYLIKPAESLSCFESDDSDVRSFKGIQSRPRMSTPVKKPKEDESEAEEPKAAPSRSPKMQSNYNNVNNKPTSSQSARMLPQNNTNDFVGEDRIQNNYNNVNNKPTSSQSARMPPQNNTNDFVGEDRPPFKQNYTILEDRIQNNYNNVNNKPTSSQSARMPPQNNTNDFVGEDRPPFKQNYTSNGSMNTKPAMNKVSSEPSDIISPASSAASLVRPRSMSRLQSAMMKMNKSATEIKSTRKCVSDDLKDTQGIMEFVEMADSDSFIAFVLPVNKFDDIELLEGITEDVKYNPNFSPSVGDTVAVDYIQDGETDTTAVRAVLLEKIGDKFKVALVDYGKTITVAKVSELPAKYEDIVDYAVCCTTDKQYLHIIKDQQRFNYHSERNREMIIDIDGESQKVLCGKWNHHQLKIEEKVAIKQLVVFTLPQAIPIKLNDRVKIISLENDLLGIRTRENHMVLQDILERLSEFKVETLQNRPAINQIVLYKGVNEKNEPSLFRAQVKLISDNIIKIFKLDFGVTEMTEVSKLYYIDKFHNIGHTLHFKELAGYQEGYENRTVQDFLKTVISKKENFIVGAQKDNEIELLFSNKISLTQKLTLLSKPPYKRLEDIPPSPEMPVGESASVMLMYVQDIDRCDVTVALCDANIQSEFLKISDKLPECEDVPASLNMNVGQACVGRYDDAWYRACIQEIDADNQYLVYFFDFGNYERVGIDDLRELPDELANLAPMAIKCHIKNIYQKFNGNVPLEYKVKLRNSEGARFQINVLSKRDDTYDITIPELE